VSGRAAPLDLHGARRYAVGGEGQQAVTTHRGVGTQLLGVDAERLGDVDGTALPRHSFLTMVDAVGKGEFGGQRSADV
jgi:hypothetical protein